MAYDPNLIKIEDIPADCRAFDSMDNGAFAKYVSSNQKNVEKINKIYYFVREIIPV